MSCTILYPLLLLLFSCDCIAEVQQEENEVQAEGTELLNVKKRGAVFTPGEFQPHIITGIQSELTQLKSTFADRRYLATETDFYTCSSMSEAQKEEKKALTERNESSPVECDAAGNKQSCLITGLCPLLAELSSTLQSLKASMDQGQFRRREEHNVAFAAALGNREDVGPFNTDVPLVYQKVFLLGHVTTQALFVSYFRIPYPFKASLLQSPDRSYPSTETDFCNCSSMSETQKEEKKTPVEFDAAGNKQSCLITGLYPLLAEISSTLQSLKASMDQEQFGRKEEHHIAFAAALGNRGDFGPFNTNVQLVYERVFLNAGSCYNTGTEYKVAFAASLGPGGNVGPFTTDITLVYKEVFVNEGRAYNSATGIFTAPVNGVYYFAFSGHNYSSKPMGLSLYKNGKLMITVYNHPQGARYETASNSISLTLEKGDQVYMRLLIMSYNILYLLLFVLFTCNCSSVSKAQEEKKTLPDKSKSLPVESGAAGNQQSCLITGLYPLLAELSSTLQSLKASMDQELLRRKEKHNIAFAAALGNRGDVGPFNTDVPLVYQKVFLNAGSCYNSGTDKSDHAIKKEKVGDRVTDSACMSEEPQQENEVQAEGTKHLNVEERGALLASGQFQPQFLTGINSELAELRFTVQQKKKEVQSKKTEHLTVEESSALLASGDFQHIFAWIHSELVELRSTVCTLKNTLQVTEEKLGQLKGKEYKVAFAVSLGAVGNVGPFTTDITLVYKEVFVNEGRAYNSATGIFTAPVNGVYFFTFSGHNHSSKPMGLGLFKNGKQMITVYNHPQGPIKFMKFNILLKSHLQPKHNVAFGARLGSTGNFGPFNTPVTLVYSNVYVNEERVYNPDTGKQMVKMSCTILYPLLLLLFTSATLSEVQQKEKEVQAKKTEHLTTEESSALLASGDFQHIFTWIHSELVELRSTVRTLKNTLQVTEEKLEQLKGKEDKVAFAASLGPGGNVGPFTTDITLVYKHVFVNEGRAYNSATGIFTAPVNGVYYFAFSGHNHSSKPMGLRLFKNGQQMITVYNHPQGARYETASNSISLTLEKGDQVYMHLRENTWVVDNENDHTTFTGHLLFSL
ncbi:complement C1q tumor necrosis factor-related 6-like protein [Labeo rohita]|uniref:Complement C1q tumor necrosis factor-related 6-like protein n=1 Tax=Labeo rohita TaxID=84645 RepID=A0A498NGI4_LABRO|nr:complement C1q tumor necrosis factor-related 6-like protein [Labeo rohita]RXN30946.1 complement C1q tumor necrosis factor-related 6-like protein [Labeo rohita]